MDIWVPTESTQAGLFSSTHGARGEKKNTCRCLRRLIHTLAAIDPTVVVLKTTKNFLILQVHLVVNIFLSCGVVTIICFVRDLYTL